MEKISKQELMLKLNDFLGKHSLNKYDFAKSVGMTEERLSAIMINANLLSEQEYAEIVIALAVIENKGWPYWAAMSREEKSEMAAKFIAAGGSTMTVGASIAAISALGVPGLSAAGIASGLAAIGAFVGGGMVAGIAICATAPLVVGATLYGICKKGRKSIIYLKNKLSA